MDDCSCNRRHVLDSGSAELETGLVMLCTWNDLADQAKHFWVLTAMPAGGGIGMLAIGTGGLDVALCSCR
jgi:hypothetical protein